MVAKVNPTFKHNWSSIRELIKMSGGERHLLSGFPTLDSRGQYYTGREIDRDRLHAFYIHWLQQQKCYFYRLDLTLHFSVCLFPIYESV